MTLTTSQRPSTLTGAQLDDYLSVGWYRMGQSIFTTNYIAPGERIYWVFWLRYHLPSILPGRSQRKILAANRHFTVAVKPFTLSRELEELYSFYKMKIDFDAPGTVSDFLFDETGRNIFDTWIVEVRDKDKLIAAGIFDNGKESIAGIMNFYHPDYSRFSPGKFLMLMKADHAKTNGKQWYYPGYIVQGLPKFDYKLFLEKEIAEIYLPTHGNWTRYDPKLIDGLVRDSLGFGI